MIATQIVCGLICIAVWLWYLWRLFVIEEAFQKRYDEAAKYWSNERELWRSERAAMQSRIDGMIKANETLQSRIDKARTALWSKK